MTEYVKVDEARYEIRNDGKCIGFASVRDNYIHALFIDKHYRRQGLGISLVRFITTERGTKLNRAPSHIKNAAIKSMSAQLGDELLEEFKQ